MMRRTLGPAKCIWAAPPSRIMFPINVPASLKTEIPSPVPANRLPVSGWISRPSGKPPDQRHRWSLRGSSANVNSGRRKGGGKGGREREGEGGERERERERERENTHPPTPPPPPPPPRGRQEDRGRSSLSSETVRPHLYYLG
jgi:hypothetical protein